MKHATSKRKPSTKSKISRKAWEEICERCGRCCYEKIDCQGKIYYTQIPCEYLDLNTRQCRIYPQREQHRCGCVVLTPELLKQGLLPADCPYVVDLDHYPAPFLADDKDPEDSF